jgi:flavin reductase (DIM6/NTAB) family NADH-FMN oxidoreductase RutF
MVAPQSSKAGAELMRRVEPSEAMALKYPEWIVMVVSRDAKGAANIMPAGWAMVCSGDPLCVAVAISYANYTCECIRETGEFVFAWAGEGQAELVSQAGSTSGRDIDKFAESRIAWSPSAVTAVPLLDGAAANLECRTVHEYDSGDHMIFVGEVVAAHVPDPPIRKLENFGDGYAVAQPTS